MSFFQPNMLTSLSPNFDEHQWVHHIRKSLDEELEEETETPITIFSVPKALMLNSPDCYTPQQIAIGPYHHFRAEVYDMERYKVSAAKRTQRELRTNLRLQDMVDHLIKFELRARASYHRPVGFGAEALAWMLAVDACFLFEFFQVCGVKKGKILTKTPSRLACLIDLSGNKNAHNAILRDIVMLENQIPMFVIRMLLEFQLSSLDLADQLLVDMLVGLSSEISPFKMIEGGPREKIEIKESAHVLDFMYHFIVPKLEAGPSDEIVHVEEEEGDENEDLSKTSSFSKPGYLRKFLDMLWQVVSGLKPRPVEWIKSIIHSKPLKVIVKLPWTILTKIPVLKMLKGPIESAFSVLKEKKDDEESGSPDNNNNNNNNKPPLLEEITIPSVTQLLEVGVQFVPTKEGGIASIGFDRKALTFQLPTIELDVNSEVFLRNLVAYEACSASGPLALTRFTELMNGIIDTEEDARVLCQRGIIVNRLKSEKEVAELWNGMSKSIRLTKVPCLDRVIGDVNKYYNGRWKVKVGNFMKRYVFGSWKILTFLAALIMLLLTSLQAFCQVYSCSRLLPIKALEPLNHS